MEEAQILQPRYGFLGVLEPKTLGQVAVHGAQGIAWESGRHATPVPGSPVDVFLKLSCGMATMLPAIRFLSLLSFFVLSGSFHLTH